MKYTVLKCDCCGKTFLDEYWREGYIDHYINFTRHFPSLVERGVQEIFYKIVNDGNDLRHKSDIKDRLKCFKTYCKNNDLLTLYTDVEQKVNDRLLHLHTLDKIRLKISKLVQGLDDEDKEYLGLEYQEY